MIKKRVRYRSIHQPDGIWKYMVGRTSVVLYSPKNEKYVEPCHKIARIEDWCRAKHKGYAKIEPWMIVEWIKSLQ